MLGLRSEGPARYQGSECDKPTFHSRADLGSHSTYRYSPSVTESEVPIACIGMNNLAPNYINQLDELMIPSLLLISMMPVSMIATFQALPETRKINLL